MADAEEPLTGGNLSLGVVRIGNTVRRPAGPWTSTIQLLLGHLETVDYPAPRPRGLDEDGREVLTFVPGEAVHPGKLGLLADEATLGRIGRLIADYHNAQSSFLVPSHPIWRTEGRDPTGSTEVIAHNDLAPWNLIAGPEGYAFIDWDLAAPGRRVWDLSWALHSFVGLWPDGIHTDDQVCRRVAAFCDGAAVGPSKRADLLEVVVERTSDHAAMLRQRAGEGDPLYTRLVNEGHADRWDQGASHVDSKREYWSHLLA